MRLDHISDIDEDSRGALLAILVHEQDQIADIAGIHSLADGRRRRLVADLVASDRLKADRLQDVDHIDDPYNRRLPVDRFEDAACGRRCH